MDILDSISNPGGEGKQGDLVSTIMELISGQNGGLNGLIQQFTSKGLGDTVSSWVGSGENLPLSADQIQNVLGSDTIKNISSKLGIDAGSLSGKLSNILPQVVDKLTPEGKVPEGNLLNEGMNILDGLFGGK